MEEGKDFALKYTQEDLNGVMKSLLSLERWFLAGLMLNFLNSLALLAASLFGFFK
jgi:hypothetical protein